MAKSKICVTLLALAAHYYSGRFKAKEILSDDVQSQLLLSSQPKPYTQQLHTLFTCYSLQNGTRRCLWMNLKCSVVAMKSICKMAALITFPTVSTLYPAKLFLRYTSNKHLMRHIFTSPLQLCLSALPKIYLESNKYHVK